MSRVAIVTDSASDLPPETAARTHIDVVPLVVTFGSESFKAGVDLTTEQFWQRMTAPDAPFPTTAASSPGDFKAAYDRCFAEGADAIISIHVAGTLSGTIKSAEIARDLVHEGDIHVIDSGTASMGEGLLALLATDLAAAGSTATEIAAVLEDRKRDLDLYVALDTLEYLRKGGRISGAQAAIGTLLSVKPIITVRDGIVHTADRPRTRGKARERVMELLLARPIERLAVLYTPPADGVAFRDELLRRLTVPIDPRNVSIQPVGPSVGPHLGPGCVGGVVLYAR
ncbi:MAG TPA: DegV family protein [Candidatus Limnocylindrales bacterium]